MYINEISKKNLQKVAKNQQNIPTKSYKNHKDFQTLSVHKKKLGLQIFDSVFDYSQNYDNFGLKFQLLV